MTGNNHNNEHFPITELTDKIIKCAQAVHKQIGNGFHEIVYKRPLAFELFIRDIPFEREMDILLNNNGVQAGKMNADFFVDGKVLVQLKSTVQLDQVPSSHTMQYMKNNNPEVGLILNFGAEHLEYRIVTHEKLDFTSSETKPN